MSTSASIVTTSGRFRDNRRGRVSVEEHFGGMAEIVVSQPGGIDYPGTTTRIVLTGEHLESLVRELTAVRNRGRRLDRGVEAVAS